jgi:hypothetical protein
VHRYRRRRRTHRLALAHRRAGPQPLAYRVTPRPADRSRNKLLAGMQSSVGTRAPRRGNHGPRAGTSPVTAWTGAGLDLDGRARVPATGVVPASGYPIMSST